jgi:hypothetical protein
VPVAELVVDKVGVTVLVCLEIQILKIQIGQHSALQVLTGVDTTMFLYVRRCECLCILIGNRFEYVLLLHIILFVLLDNF